MKKKLENLPFGYQFNFQKALFFWNHIWKDMMNE